MSYEFDKIGEVANDIYFEIVNAMPEYNFVINCEPFRDFITFYIVDYPDDIVNMDYMKWVKSKLEKKTFPKPGSFFSDKVILDLQRMKEIFRSYGGREFLDHEEGDFDYFGPYFQRESLRFIVREAAEKVGLSYSDWKKFWRRNSMKIKKDMEPYFEDITKDFPCWRWGK